MLSLCQFIATTPKCKEIKLHSFPRVDTRVQMKSTLLPQRTLLIKKQQKKRADSQMVTANWDTRKKNLKLKAAQSDETPLLISQSLSNASLSGWYLDN